MSSFMLPLTITRVTVPSMDPVGGLGSCLAHSFSWVPRRIPQQKATAIATITRQLGLRRHASQIKRMTMHNAEPPNEVVPLPQIQPSQKKQHCHSQYAFFSGIADSFTDYQVFSANAVRRCGPREICRNYVQCYKARVGLLSAADGADGFKGDKLH